MMVISHLHVYGSSAVVVMAMVKGHVACNHARAGQPPGSLQPLRRSDRLCFAARLGRRRRRARAGVVQVHAASYPNLPIRPLR